METAKDYHKNSKENKKGKTKSKHQESPTRTKVHDSPTMAYISTLFPFVKKSFASEKWKSENKGVLFSCPETSCKCSFTVSTADLESQIMVCPKGHNICSEVLSFFYFFFIFLVKKCLELSHYPISCKIFKEWMETGFSYLRNRKEPDLLLLNCPLCKAAVKEEQKNGRNHCPKCNKSYCSKCMQEYLYMWDLSHHGHCGKNNNKGEIRNKTEEFFKHLEFIKMDFPKFMQEKTREEEQLKEQMIYIEEKIEKFKEENEFEKEEMFAFLYFLDAVNGIFIHLFYFFKVKN